MVVVVVGVVVVVVVVVVDVVVVDVDDVLKNSILVSLLLFLSLSTLSLLLLTIIMCLLSWDDKSLLSRPEVSTPVSTLVTTPDTWSQVTLVSSYGEGSSLTPPDLLLLCATTRHLSLLPHISWVSLLWQENSWSLVSSLKGAQPTMADHYDQVILPPPTCWYSTSKASAHS